MVISDHAYNAYDDEFSMFSLSTIVTSNKQNVFLGIHEAHATVWVITNSKK